MEKVKFYDGRKGEIDWVKIISGCTIAAMFGTVSWAVLHLPWYVTVFVSLYGLGVPIQWGRRWEPIDD